MVQIPRLYNVFHEEGSVQNFQQMIDNIFEPLFAVTLDPQSDVKLHLFLQQLCGFDSVGMRACKSSVCERLADDFGRRRIEE